MDRPSESLVVNPLFYDALSGDFYANKSIFQQPHTLGRLSIECFQDGSVIESEHIENGSSALITVEFIPSWALEVTAVTQASKINSNLGQPSARLHGISLIHEDGKSIRISEETVTKDPPSHTLEIESTEMIFFRAPLTLKSVGFLRTYVTSSTQEFFDNIR